MRGFVDLQVNGFVGVDFSAPGLTLDDVLRVSQELKSRGTHAFCPTIITSPLDTYEKNLPILAEAHFHPECGKQLLGIHLEGPFISALDGARGAHPLESVRLPDVPLFEKLLDWSQRKVSLLTLAPELPGALSLIERATELGIAVSLGHHLSDSEQIRDAVNAGASASTHLGNGLPNQLPRHPNPIWPQIANSHLSAMLITDGHHVPEDFIKSVIRAKSVDKIIVVSDSAPIAGFKPGRYITLGQEVLLEETGRLWNPTGNHLVGSSASMMDCMNHLASLSLLSEAELWRVGRDNPLQLIGRSLDQMDNEPPVEYVDSRFRIRSISLNS